MDCGVEESGDGCGMPSSSGPNSVISAFTAAILGLGLNEAAYMSEIVRSGLLSVPAGQREAAKAIGMTTVWVNNGSEQGGHGAERDFVDVEIADVGDWLRELLGVTA